MIANFALLVAAFALAEPTGPTADGVAVTVSNPLRAARPVETIALSMADILKAAPTLQARRTIVVDANGKAVESQLVDLDADGKPDELVFQSTFAAGERKEFVVRAGERRSPTRDDFRVYGRFARERHDDFAWENDRVAHRMYGPALETWAEEPLTSSGVDVWSKRVRRLVVNNWYMTDNYHQDSGEGADLYSVGKSRGCGGIGVWADGKLYVSRNFIISRVLANGPIRLVFELEYAPWDAAGRMVSETKRITLDAGQAFNRFESTFQTPGGTTPLALGIGIAKHEGGVVRFDKKGGWMRAWEPLKQQNGNLGCAIVASPRLVVEQKASELDSLLIVSAGAGRTATYYVGTAWDRGGDVADPAAWAEAVEGFARAVSAPLQVSLSAVRVGAALAEPTGTDAPARAGSDDRKWSARTCDSVMSDGPTLTDKWAYDAGLVLQGCLQVWSATNDSRYLSFVKQSVDHLIDADGNIKGYKLDDYNLDNINMGKVLFSLRAHSASPADAERYRKAIFLLRSQLKTQPRTADRAFWHKLIYPRQMWLDGVYMASPFLAQFAAVFNEPSALDDAALQILAAETHMRDPKSGLLFHGWDETKEQRWANPKTGTSSQFWGRAMGWYAMGIVDVLEFMPKAHPQRPAILAVLRRLATAIASVQDRNSGVWWQVLDAPGRPKNYEEASASSMFVYALAKGIKNRWLDPKTFGPVVSRGFRGITETFATTTPGGRVSLKNTCTAAGLGGNPYRDGSFAYYTSVETSTEDFKGLGAFVLASAIIE